MKSETARAAINERTLTDSDRSVARREQAAASAANRLAASIDEQRTEGHFHNYCPGANPHEPI